MVCISLLCLLTIWQLTTRVSGMGSMATAETASLENGVTIGVDSEYNRTENPFKKTVSKHNMINTTPGSKISRSRRKKTQGKVQNRRKQQFRRLEPPDTCMNWSPSFNVTPDHNFRRLAVDYCQSERLPIPDTYTCVTKTEITLCTVVESPHCRHVFENLTAGNYTILVKPLCKVCFDVEVYNTECITPIYTKYIHLEEPTEDNSSAEKKQGYSTHLEIIVPASCAGAAAVIILVVIVYLLAKYRNCRKILLCGRRNVAINQTLPNFTGQPATDDQTITARLRNTQLYYQEQETSFMSKENSAETEAMLSNSVRLAKEQALLYPEAQSLIPLRADPSPSMTTSFSEIPSCWTLSTSSVEIRDTHSKDQESLSSCTENDHQETLQTYFDMYTGIINGPANLLPVSETMDIPIHLVFTDDN